MTVVADETRWQEYLNAGTEAYQRGVLCERQQIEKSLRITPHELRQQGIARAYDYRSKVVGLNLKRGKPYKHIDGPPTGKIE